MRAGALKWMVPCLLVLAGAWLFWRAGNRPADDAAPRARFSYTAPRPVLPGQVPAANEPMPARVKAALATNGIALRLSNTPKSIGELVHDGHAILLENALIDTRRPLDFSIPKHLRARDGDRQLHRPGARAGGRGVSRGAGAGGGADRFLHTERRLPGAAAGAGRGGACRRPARRSR